MIPKSLFGSSVSIISDKVKDRFIKAGYRIVGKHSAVDICHWTKESLRNGRTCYKEKWYGIESHRCMEMTPSLIWCTQRCLFCWRPLEYTVHGEPEPDLPKNIIEGCMSARRKLLSGFKGNCNVNREKWKESIEPTSAALSLAGEPTMYPLISELLEELDGRGMKTFLVTNGTRPDRLEMLRKEPTTLYISLTAPDKKSYFRLSRPTIKNGWERIIRSLEVMRSFNCRKVIRLTLVNSLNMFNPEGYAKSILDADPDFVEPKGYMHVGESQKRLCRTHMPNRLEIMNFAENISELTGYSIKDYSAESRVALLSKK